MAISQVSYTYDELIVALAREAFKENWPIDLSTTAAGATADKIVCGHLAFGASGATAQKFHDQWMYYRRVRGTATAGAATTLTTNKNFGGTSNTLTDGQIRITAGTGSGQKRTILTNSSGVNSVITVSAAWATNPDATSQYEIYPPDSADLIRVSKSLSTSPFDTPTGTITVAPLFSQIPVAQTDFLFCRDVHPSFFRRAINDVLRNTPLWAYQAVTQIPDGDQEEVGVTNWATIGTVTTKEKVASVFPLFRQSLHVITGASNSGVRSAVADIAPNNPSLHVAALVQINSNAHTLEVQLRNAVSGAIVKTVTVVGTNPTVVAYSTVTGAADEYTLDFVAPTSGTEFWVGPAWLVDDFTTRLSHSGSFKSGYVEVYSLDMAYALGNDLYNFNTALSEVEHTKRHEGSTHQASVEFRSPLPCIVRTLGRWPELAADLDTTFVNKDIIINGAMYYLLRRRAAPQTDNADASRILEGSATRYGRIFSRLLDAEGIPAAILQEVPTSRIQVV